MAIVDCRDALKLILHLVGAIVNGAVLCQAAWILSHPQTAGLTDFCSWLSQGFLFAFVGMIGMVLEFWTVFKLYAEGLGGFFKTVARRTTLGGYYFWLGCCALGGMRASVAASTSNQSTTWEVVDSTIGIQSLEIAIGFCAWFAAALNVLTSCCMDELARDTYDEEKAALVSKKAAKLTDPFLTASPKGTFQSAVSAEAKQQAAPAMYCVPEGGWNSYSGESKSFAAPSLGGKQESFQSLGNSFQSQADEKTQAAVAVGAPDGGWNSVSLQKPFGCA